MTQLTMCLDNVVVEAGNRERAKIYFSQAPSFLEKRLSSLLESKEEIELMVYTQGICVLSRVGRIERMWMGQVIELVSQEKTDA